MTVISVSHGAYSFALLLMEVDEAGQVAYVDALNSTSNVMYRGKVKGRNRLYMWKFL